jgi:hypothetical protein
LRILPAERDKACSVAFLTAYRWVVFNDHHTTNAYSFVGGKLVKPAYGGRGCRDAKFRTMLLCVEPVGLPGSEGRPEVIISKLASHFCKNISVWYVPGLEALVEEVKETIATGIFPV